MTANEVRRGVFAALVVARRPTADAWPGCRRASGSSTEEGGAAISNTGVDKGCLITVPQTVSIALGAALIAVTGYRPLLAVMAAVMVLAAAHLLTRPELRGVQPADALVAASTEMQSSSTSPSACREVRDAP